MEPRKASIDDRVSALQFGAIDYVFLDRDGVVNRKRPERDQVTQIERPELMPGAADAIARLNTSGRKVDLVTNQRGVTLGLITELDGLISISVFEQNWPASGRQSTPSTTVPTTTTPATAVNQGQA